MPGTLFVVATPIGNLDDLSSRAVRTLREVALIAAEDTRRTAHLLARFAIQTPTTSLNEHNETGKTGPIIGRLMAGESVALVSDAGTPTVSDPGSHLIRAAAEAGIRVEPIPGASAILALLSVAALPTSSFTFLGFVPSKANDRIRFFDNVLKENRTVVFFEAPHRLQPTLQAMKGHFGDCHIVVGRELTKVHEEIFRGPVSEALRRFVEPVGEFVIAINLAEHQNLSPPEPISAVQVLQAVAESKGTPGTSKRRVIQEVARKLGLTPNRVYEIVESAKGSGEQQK